MLQALAGPRAIAAQPASFAEVSRRMQAFVDDGTIAGSVTLVARHDQIASLEAVGFADLALKKPMRTDNLFWIASMTKPITAVAVLMLQDEGKLNVEDAVEKYLPEFKNQWLIEEKGTNALKLVRPTRPITLRDLLTHTSGLGDFASPRNDSTLAELVMAYSQLPLKFPPGSKWEYCNSGINTLGRVVEVVSGRKFEDFLQQRIFNPLAMKDTTFWPAPGQARRIAKSYKPAKTGGGLEETAVSFVKGGLGDRRRTPIPAGGLFSTARDVARFYQMTLNGGILEGRRIISKESLALMTRTQTGDIKTGFTDGMSWGFGFQVVKEPQGVTAMLSPGTYGHGGAYATQSWADPKKDLILVLMIQRAGFPNGDNSPVRRAFQEAAVAAMKN
ncbi:MAG: beta-lactamase family protein [Verrucomicrobia bacterium]|nr:beta-lactamase family protein [Verrucomicrobiota bacterium]